MSFSKHYVGMFDFFILKTLGATHDYNIFAERVSNLQQILQKTASDQNFCDNGELVDDYPNFWACFFDKAYVGANERVQAIIPTKIGSQPLTNAQVRCNDTVSGERVKAENFYGRMTALWGVIAKKYRWDHQLYDKAMGIAIVLTNAHIDITPLHDDEHVLYRSLLQEYHNVAAEQLEQERASKERSCQRVRERV